MVKSWPIVPRSLRGTSSCPGCWRAMVPSVQGSECRRRVCPECLALPPIFGIWLFWGWPEEVVLWDALPVLCWLCFTLGSGGDPVMGPRPHGGLCLILAPSACPPSTQSLLQVRPRRSGAGAHPRSPPKSPPALFPSLPPIEIPGVGRYHPSHPPAEVLVPLDLHSTGGPLLGLSRIHFVVMSTPLGSEPSHLSTSLSMEWGDEVSAS